MRVWIDVSNSPQVLFVAPLIRLLRDRGHGIEVTTREYAQTVELLRRHDIAHTVVGPEHGGAGAPAKARAMVQRFRALRRHVRGRSIDVAFSHASHELPLVARSLEIPSAYAFDYELARAQHSLGSRAARRVIVPAAIPQARLDRLGAHERNVRRYPGLKEEYYLHGFQPTTAVLDELGIDRGRVFAVLRTPPEVSLYHRHGNPLFTDVLERLGRDPGVQTVVLARTPAQREAILGRDLPSVVLPDHAIDAQSLVAFSDLVVSAGGTMTREAVALGVPAYTVFAGRRGAVEDSLLQDGRLRLLGSADDLELAKRASSYAPPQRDPALVLDLLLSALDS